MVRVSRRDRVRLVSGIDVRGRMIARAMRARRALAEKLDTWSLRRARRHCRPRAAIQPPFVGEIPGAIGESAGGYAAAGAQNADAQRGGSVGGGARG